MLPTTHHQLVNKEERLAAKKTLNYWKPKQRLYESEYCTCKPEAL